MPMKKRTEKRLQVEVDKCIRQISLTYELKHFNDRLEATLGTRGFSRVRRVFSTCASEFTLALVRSAAGLVCSHPFLMSSRNAPGRALRDDTKNACVTDYCRPRQSLGWAMEPLVADLIDIRKSRMPLTWVLWVCHSLQENPFRGLPSHARASR